MIGLCITPRQDSLLASGSGRGVALIQVNHRGFVLPIGNTLPTDECVAGGSDRARPNRFLVKSKARRYGFKGVRFTHERTEREGHVRNINDQIGPSRFDIGAGLRGRIRSILEFIKDAGHGGRHVNVCDGGLRCRTRYLRTVASETMCPVA